MTPENARALARERPALRHAALWLWARVRRGRHVPPAVMLSVPAERRAQHPLLGGLVEATVLHKAPA